MSKPARPFSSAVIGSCGQRRCQVGTREAKQGDVHKRLIGGRLRSGCKSLVEDGTGRLRMWCRYDVPGVQLGRC